MQPVLPQILRHVGPMLFAAFAAFSLSTCVEPQATDCPTGVACPAGKKCALNQPVCIVTDCGNGTVEGEELCDDGNILPGDGCSSDCKSVEVCGNTVVDTAKGEVCNDRKFVSCD